MRAIGFHIEGIGQTLSGGADKGVVFYASKHDPSWFTSGDSADYSWERKLVDLPSESTTKADPAKGDLDTAAYTPTLTMDGTVSQLLNAKQSKPSFYLHANALKSDKVLDFGASGLFASLPQAVYIGQETIRVHTDNNDGTYDVERGIWSSTALAHAGSTDANDQRAGVFERPPFYDNRLIWFVTVDSAGSVDQHGYMYWDDYDIQGANTAFQIETTEAFQLTKDAEVNQAPRKWSFYQVLGGIENTETYPRRPTTPENVHYSQVAKRYDKDGSPNGNWLEKNQFFHVTREETTAESSPDKDKTIARIREDNPAGSGIVSSLNIPDFDYLEDYRDIFPRPKDRPKADGSGTTVAQPPNKSLYTGWEVAHWDRVNDIAPFPLADAEAAFGFSRAAYHPLCVAAALLFSTDADQIDPDELDLLNGHLGLDAGFLFGDKGKQSFIDEAKRSKGKKVTKFTVGWGGDPVEVTNMVMNLLVSNGYFLAARQDGHLEVNRFETITAEEAAKADGRPVTPVFDQQGEAIWSWDGDDEMGRSMIGGPVGKTPLAEGTKREALAIEASTRITKMVDPSSRDRSFPHKSSDRDGFTGDPGVVGAFLARQAELMHMRMPKVRFKAPDPYAAGVTYDIGKWIKIVQPDDADPDLFYETDGTLVDPADVDKPWRFFGMIVERKWQPASNSYILTCLLTNYDTTVGRFRAPAGIVDSTTSSSVTLKNDSFSTGDDDAQAFKVGQFVNLLDRNLSDGDGSDSWEITGISGDTLDFGNDDPSEAVDGDILTLASYDSFSPTNSLGLTEFAFLADSNDNLGSANDDAHTWQ